MIVYILTFFIIFSSFIIPETVIAPNLQEPYNRYMFLINKYCKDKTKINDPPQKYIIFGDLDQGKIGETTRYTFKYTVIMSPPYWWTRSSDSDLISFDHEMGHAVLRLDHSKDPKNYMYPFDEGYNLKEVEQQVIADIIRVCQ